MRDGSQCSLIESARRVMRGTAQWFSLVGVFLAGSASAGPEGGQVVGGHGSISQQGVNTTIDQVSARLAIDWESFNLEAHESVRFHQPDSSSVAMNRIFDQNPSHIFGAIDANGRVFFLNPNGMIFGSSARINVAGLLASSARISLDNFMAGEYTLQNGDDAAGVIRNEGLIQAEDGGFVVLFGEGVENEGVIFADLGSITLAAGKSATLDFNGDGTLLFEISEQVTENLTPLKDGVSNTGELVANGGRIVMTAAAARDVFSRAVNNEGIAVANRIDNSGGTIRLVSGGDTVNSGTLTASGDSSSIGGRVEVLGDRVGLANGSEIDVSGGLGGGTALIGGGYQGRDPDVLNAHLTIVGSDTLINADAVGNGDGGQVIVWADSTTRFHGEISARGGAAGGDGGFVEVSGKQWLDFAGTVDTRAPLGSMGTLLLDPVDITILDGTGDGEADGDSTFAGDLSGVEGTVVAGDNTPTQIFESELEGIAAGTNILLQATNNITIEELVTDGNLNLATTGSVQFIADADNDGAGAFSMSTGDTITTAGANVIIDGYIVTVGSIDAGVGDITLNAGTDLTMAGTYTGDTGSFNFGQNDTGGTLNLNTATLALTGAATGTGGAGDDTFNINASVTANLQGGDGADSFIFADGATLTGTVDGGAGVDDLDFTANTTGITVDLNAAGATDGFDGTEASISGGFANIDAVAGGSAADTFNVNASGAASLSGNGGDDVFNLAGDLTGTVSGNAGADDFNVTALQTAADLQGGAGADNFNFELGSAGSAGTAAGGGDGDTFNVNDAIAVDLSGEGGDDVFNLAADATGVNAGGPGNDQFNVMVDLTANLDGQEGNDTFNLDADLTGVAIGGLGNDDFNVTATQTATDLQGGAGADNFNFEIGSAGSAGTAAGGGDGDTFNVNDAIAVDLSGEGGNDTFNLAANASGINSGGTDDDTFNINASVTANLQGGDGADSFIFADGATLTGTVDGGAGVDDLDFTANTTGITVDLNAAGATDGFDGTETSISGGFSNIDAVAGGSAADTFNVNASGAANLSGNGGDDVFNLAGDLTGTVSGSAGDDSFVFGDGVTLTGTVDGGAGLDVLDFTANTTGITVELNAAGATDGIDGTETSITGGFNNLDQIIGGAVDDVFRINASVTGDLAGNGGADSFIFADGATLTGTIDGGPGVDELDFSANTTGITVDMNAAGATDGFDGTEASIAGGFSNIDAISGGNGADIFTVTAAGIASLAGNGGDDTFNLHADLSGTAAGGDGDDTFNVNGSVTANLQGGDGADSFIFADGATLTGTVDGGAGMDDLDFTANTTGITVDLNAAGATDGFDGTEASISGGFANVDAVAGGSAADTFNVNASGAANLSGNGGDDVFNLAGDLTGTVSGNAGADDFNVTALQTAADLQGGAGADTFDFEAGSAGTSGSVSGGDGDDTFNINAAIAANLSGDAGADVFNLAEDAGGITSGGTGDDTFNINESVTANLQGGDGADSFIFADGVTLTGTVDGGAGVDDLDFTANTTGITVDLNAAGATDGFDGTEASISGGFANIDAVAGGSAADTFNVNASGAANLSGNGGDDVFNLAGDLTGTVSGNAGADDFNVTALQTAADLQGGAGADTFDFEAGSAGTSGSVSGGDGDDTFNVNAAIAANLSGDAGADVFNLAEDASGITSGGTGDDTFNVNASVTANLQGDADADTLVLADGVTLTGTFDGGAGLDELDFSADTGGISVVLASIGGTDGFDGAEARITRGFSNVDAVTGGAGTDTLTGTNANAQFVIGAGRYQSDGNTLTFADIENLTGGSAADTFVFAEGVSVAGAIDGAAGADVLDYSGVTSVTNVTLTSAGTSDGFAGTQGAIVAGFDNVDSVVVTDGTLTGANAISAWTFAPTSEVTVSGQTLSFAGFGAVAGGSANDTFTFTGTPTTPGGFSVDGGGGTNNVDITGAVDFGGETFTLSNVNGVTLDNSVTAGTLNWTAGGQVSQTGGALTANRLNLQSVGGASLGGLNQLQMLSTTNTGAGVVAVTNARELTADIENTLGNIVVNLVGGSGSTLTIGELISNGDFDINANGNILASGSTIPFQGGSASQAVLTAGGGIGGQGQPVSFSGFSASQLPNGQAPIVLNYNLFAFINPIGGTPVQDNGGQAVVSARESLAILAEADAASRRDATDIDWAAYSEEIRLYSVNNEGVQLPEDQRLDEFAKLHRWLRNALQQPEMTIRDEN